MVVARQAIFHAHAVEPEKSLAVGHVEALAQAFIAHDPDGVGALLDFWHFTWTGRFATGTFLSEETLPRPVKLLLQPIVSAGGRPALYAAQSGLLREARRRLTAEAEEAAAANRVMGRELFLRPVQAFLEDDPDACLLLTKSPADAVKAVNNALLKPLPLGGVRYQQVVETADRITERMREVATLTDIVRQSPPPVALRLGHDETAQVSGPARGLLPLVLLDLTEESTESSDPFDTVPVLDLLEAHLSLLDTEEALRPALALAETGRTGGVVTETQTYLTSIRGRLGGVARHIAESPELMELLDEVRAEVAQGWTGQVDTLLELARPLVLRGKRLERTGALRARLAELDAGTAEAADEEKTGEEGSAAARLAAIVDTAERTEDEDAAAQLLSLAEEMAQRLVPGRSAGGGSRTRPHGAPAVRSGEPVVVPPIVLLAELLEDPWHPLLPQALRSVTAPGKAARAFEELAGTGSGPVQRAAAVCAIGWSLLDRRPEDALQQHARLAERASRSAGRSWNEGCARSALGDLDGAVVAFEAVARLGDSPPQLVVQPVLDLFRAAGRPCPFREPLRQGPAPEVRIDAFVAQRFEATAKQLRLRGRTADAELLLESLTEVSPTAPGRSLLMKIYREEHRLADAERFVTRMSSRLADDWMLDFDLALVAVDSGDTRRAGELRDRLADADAPEQHLLHLERRLANSVRPVGETSTSAPPHPAEPSRPQDLGLPPVLLHEDLLVPDSDTLPDGLRAALARTESPLEAAHAFADWSADAPGRAATAAAVCAVGWACRAGAADLAAHWANTLLPADASGWLLWNRASALRLLGDTDGAARTLEQALTGEEQTPQAVWPMVAEILSAAGRPVPPQAYGVTASGPRPPARITSATAQHFESLAKRLYTVNRPADAELLLRALVEAAPRAPGLLLLMKIWREGRRLDDALALVSQRRALGEEDWRLCYEAGLVAVAAGRTSIALEMRHQVAALGGPTDWMVQLDRRIGTSRIGTPVGRAIPRGTFGQHATTPEQHIVQRALNGPQNKPALLEPARQLLDEQGPSPVLAVARQLERTATWACLTLLDLLIERAAEQPDHQVPAGLVEQVLAGKDAKLVVRLASVLDDLGDRTEAARLLSEFAQQCRPTQRPRIWHQLVQLLRRTGRHEEADRLAARTTPPLPGQPLQPVPDRSVSLQPRLNRLVLPARVNGESSPLHHAQELEQLQGPEAAADAWCTALEAGHVIAYPHALGALVAADRAQEALELYRGYAGRLWTGSSSAWNIAAAYARLGLLDEAADTLEIEAQISSWAALAADDRARLDEIFRAVGRPSPGGLLTSGSASAVAGSAPAEAAPEGADPGHPSTGSPAAGTGSPAVAPPAEVPVPVARLARAKAVEWEDRAAAQAVHNALAVHEPGSPGFAQRSRDLRAGYGRLIEGLAGEAERYIRPAPRSLTQVDLERMTAAAAAPFAEGLAAAQEDRRHDAARDLRTAFEAQPRNEVIAANLVLALVRTDELDLARQLIDGFLFSSSFIRPRVAVAHASGGAAEAIAEIGRMRAQDLGLGRTELPLAQAGLELHHLDDPGAAAGTLLSVATDRPAGLGRLFAAVALLLGQDAGDSGLVEEAYRCLMRPTPPVNEIVHTALGARRPDHLTLVAKQIRGALLGRVANARSEELRRDRPSHRRLQLMRALLEQRRIISPDARWLYARMLWQDGESDQAAHCYQEVVQELSVRPGRPNLATAVEEWIQAARSSGDPSVHRAALSTKQDLGLPMRTRELEILRGDEVAHESLLLDLNAEVVSLEAVDMVDAQLESVHRLERVAESLRAVAFGSQDEVTVDQLIDVWYHQLAQDIDSDEGRARLMDLRNQALGLCRRVGDPSLREMVQRVSRVTYRLWEESARRLLPRRVDEAFLVTEAELWCHGEGPLHARLTVEPREDGGYIHIGWNGSPLAKVDLVHGCSQQVVFRVDELRQVDRVELDFLLYRPGEAEAENLKTAYPVESRSEDELGRHAFAPTSPADGRVRVPRDAELRMLRQHYTGRRVAPVRFLHGPRQVGKTTLARSLAAHPLPENPAEWPLPGILAVDLNGEQWIPGQAPPLWEWFAKEIVRRLKEVRATRVHVTEPLPTTGYAFSEWLRDISIEGLDDWCLLLMIDEFQRLLDRVSASGQSVRDLGDELRGMITDHRTPLLLLTLGSCSFESLKERLVPHQSNLTDEITRFPVGFMEPDQAVRIVRLGFDDSVHLQKAAMELLVEYTGGYPYHVHCMGEQLATQLVHRKASIITPEDVEVAAHALVENPEVLRPIADLQSEPGVERAVAYLLENETTQDDELTRIDGDAVDMPAVDPEVDRGLDRIKELGLIRRDGHSDWGWSNRLIYLWLKERHARRLLKAQARASAVPVPAAVAPEPEAAEDPAEALRRVGFELGDQLGQQTVDDFAAARKVVLNGRTAVAKLLNPDGDPDRCRALRARFEALERSVSSGAPRLLRERGVVEDRWFVFEWMDGVPLDAAIRDHDRVRYAWQDAVEWVADAAGVVARAYREGSLTHGDLKPENLLRAPDGRVTVLDWGGGNLRGEVSPIFRDHAFDRRYAPTEQGIHDLGEEPTGVLPSDDAYSLAATLFELVHPDRRPFCHCRDDEQDPFGPTEHSELENHFLAIRRNTSLALEGVLRAGLSRVPAHRLDNAEQLAAELKRVIRT
ncbi:hypothetical protein ACIRU3_07295 [Streptomyces sp. NPDC101151]|uniref:hypothetical protein n=1 Tax=Streptomyces sp. NPDC101151 TaxID=3366115 RepID=UPI0037FFFCF0